MLQNQEIINSQYLVLQKLIKDIQIMKLELLKKMQLED